MFSCAAILVATSYAAAAGGTNIRTMSNEEAAAFENSLIARGRQPIDPLERVFTQPVNKTEPCKLPTTKDQLERKRFRAYWDGDCKNGYAYGLGRDIAISDTHHVEEITIHGGDGEFNANQPWVLYDFVNNRSAHGVRGNKYPATSGLNQTVNNDPLNFTTFFTVGSTDESGNQRFYQTSPLDPRKAQLNVQGSVVYRLTDLSDVPAASNQPLKAIEILDAKTGIAGGVRIVFFRNGAVEHQKLDASGQVVERAAIPQEYVNHLVSKGAEIQEAVASANASAQRAQQMEREYLYMACNGKHSIKGLDNATATEICTWRDRFKEPYEKALANYQKQMEQQRQQAAAQEQQLAQQRQLAAVQGQQLAQQQMYQAQLAQQQAAANQQAWQNTTNALQNTVNQITQQTQSLINSQVPQVQPISPSGGDRVICNTLSNGTVICK